MNMTDSLGVGEGDETCNGNILYKQYSIYSGTSSVRAGCVVRRGNLSKNKHRPLFVGGIFMFLGIAFKGAHDVSSGTFSKYPGI
jgi:hypothetical protein